MAFATDRRRHPRVDLLAQAQVSSMGEVYLLTVRNASRTGLYLDGPPGRHPELQLDIAVDVQITPLEQPEAAPIGLQARVVRIDHDPERPGFALEIEVMDDRSAVALEALLGETAED